MNGLTHFEERLLWILSGKPRGELVTRSEIISNLYPGGPYEKEPPKTNSLEVLVSRLRKKGFPDIRAVRGKGYIFNQPTSTEDFGYKP